MARTIPAEQFVEIWQQSECIEQVAEQTGQSIQTAQCRAAVYRRRGVPLKKFPRRASALPAGRKPLDVAALTDIARKAS